MLYDPKDYILNSREFDAVYDWVRAEKDRLPGDVKNAILKLVNGEQKRQVFGVNWGASMMGQKGGSATSEAKRITSAENGKKGGRPPARIVNPVREIASPPKDEPPARIVKSKGEK